MREKPQNFFQFRLSEPINCYQDTFAVIVDQQGNRLVNIKQPDSSGKRFHPSAFSLMLMYHNEDTGRTEIVASTFDNHFKLALTVHDKTLPMGTYIIMVAPQWHKSAYKDAEYLHLRVGVYAPSKIDLLKF